MIVWKMNNWPTAEQTAMMPMCGRIDGLALRKVTTGTISSVTSRPVCEGRGIRSVGAGPGRGGLGRGWVLRRVELGGVGARLVM